MTVRIIRRNLKCGWILSSILRTSGKRRNIKFIIFCGLLFLFTLMIFRRTDRTFMDNIKSGDSSFDDYMINAPAAIRSFREYVVEEHETQLDVCPESPPILVGPMNVNPNITPSMRDVEEISGMDLSRGGCYKPTTCKPLQKIAIIIPFKDRDAHLKTLLYYLHPMLRRQKNHYCIYVTEQFDSGQFNKALIMNAGFEEVMKIDRYDCIIFHDVDMIPENDNNLYSCGKHPRHLSPAIDKFKYKPHYGTEFGGVTGITPEQYRKANGHSNQFWGWGGEDNDMEFRIHYNGMKIEPSPLKIGRYKMIVHKHPWKFSPTQFPWKLNKTRESRAKTDGLSDLQYRLVNIDSHPTHTKLMIDIRRIIVKRVTLYIDGKPSMDIDIEPGECRWDEYEGKYLDFNIELSDVKEAAHLRDLRMNQPRQNAYPVIPNHIKIDIPTTPETKIRFSLVDNFTEAKILCEKLYPECQGVQRENSEEKYSLRRNKIPRNIVVTGPAEPQILRKSNNLPSEVLRKKYYFPKKIAFVKYCPGDSEYIQGYKTPLQVDLALNKTKIQHTYSFDVHFSVVMQPSKSLHYHDKKQFEAQLSKGENIFTFAWPHGKFPNFSLPETPREFTFRTTDFAIPNIPGCYSIESKIEGDLHQPYYQWNWWFEVKSDDRERDAIARELFWRTQMQENAAHAKLSQRLSIARKKQALQAKREYEFQKQMAEFHKNDLNPPKNKIKRNEEVENENTEREKRDIEKVMNKKEIGEIQVFEASRTIGPVIQERPKKIEVVQKVVRNSYHAALPPHLLNSNTV